VLLYVLRRVVQAAVVTVGVSIIAFALIHLVPGDPIRVSLGTRYDPQTAALLRHESGLDRPLVQQYLRWASHALRGDLGVSFETQEPVGRAIVQRLPATLTLAGAALLVALLIALPLGVVAAVRAGTVVDYGATAVSQVGVSIPDFWIGIMLIFLVAGKWGWLPPSGYVSIGHSFTAWLSHLVLPALSVGLVSGSILSRFVRASMIETLAQDYTRTARARGLSNRAVVIRHALRNALPPIVTVTGLQLAYLLGGVIVVETIFAWPGLGRLALGAAQTRDYPMLQGTILLFALTFVVVNLFVDLVYGLIDPRIQIR
jgi:peptide/nickel transport system permease protein